MLDRLTLFHLEMTATVAAILGTICAVTMTATRIKYTVKTKKHVEKIREFGVATENARLTVMHAFASRFAFIFYSVSLVFLITCISLQSYAVDRGAYGSFTTDMSLSEIIRNNRYGYVDQSEELPEDVKGCVILFFKWGCEDCNNIHDELLAKLQEYDLFKTYFVSSQSEKGQALIEKYPVDSVPYGIYIYYDEEHGTPYQGYALNDGDSLNTYNLDTLLSVQRYIRSFELPEEYSDDAFDEIPEEYRLDGSGK